MSELLVGPKNVDDEAAEPQQETSDTDLWSPEFRSVDLVRQSCKEIYNLSGRPATDMGVYKIAGESKLSSPARLVEETVFKERFGDKPEELKSVYARFEKSGKTDFLLVVDHSSMMPAGMMRTIRGTEADATPTLNVLQDPESPWYCSPERYHELMGRFAAKDVAGVIDIATLGVDGKYTNKDNPLSTAKALMSAVFRDALASDADTWVTILDKFPYDIIQDYTLNVFESFDGLGWAPFLGSKSSQPEWSNFREYEVRLREQNERRHGALAKSEGFKDYSFVIADTIR